MGPGSKLRRAVDQYRVRVERTLGDAAAPIYRRAVGFEPSGDTRFLMVLSHPRSGSTLLSHVLASNDDIAGFDEQQICYRSAADLDRLVHRTAYRARDLRLDAGYVLDRVLWRRYELADEVLADPRARFVFLVRRPEETLPSLARSFPILDTDVGRFRHYQRQLSHLRATAQRIDDPGRCFFLTFDDLTRRTAVTLAGLSEFLGLRTPLTAHYDVDIGGGRVEPTSDLLRLGRVIQPPPNADSSIPNVIARAADDAYRDAVDDLRALRRGLPAAIRSLH